MESTPLFKCRCLEKVETLHHAPGKCTRGPDIECVRCGIAVCYACSCENVSALGDDDDMICLTCWNLSLGGKK